MLDCRNGRNIKNESQKWGNFWEKGMNVAGEKKNLQNQPIQIYKRIFVNYCGKLENQMYLNGFSEKFDFFLKASMC